jgi:trehalose 6-phosphate phosphatase
MECASHKDAFMTGGESLPAPPMLDPRSALFLDVDGTLLEIAARPELVEVHAELPTVLLRLAQEREGALALISGRSLARLDELFRPRRGAAAGLHGIERRRADGTLTSVLDSLSATALDRIRPKLIALAADGNELLLEDKGATIALHYRMAPRREPEIIDVAQSLQREADSALRLIKGKMVIEFLPRNANKGTAIAAFLAEPPFCGRPPVFVGDDTTDEDGFAEIRRRGGIGVRVGSPGNTAASHGLPCVNAVLAWLARNALS